jgi:hypothetical protein
LIWLAIGYESSGVYTPDCATICSL